MNPAPTPVLRSAALAVFLASPLSAQDAQAGLVERVFAAKREAFADLLEDPAGFRLQVLLSVVAQDEVGCATLERHEYRTDAEYFYPASTVKTFAAVAALRELDALSTRHGAALDEHTPLRFHPLFDDEELEESDESNVAGGTITVGHEVRKLFLVSDNRAYNRLYELVGQRELNELVWRAGLPGVRLAHRLSEFRSPRDQRRTPRIELLPHGADPIVVPQRDSSLQIRHADDTPGILAGEAHMRGGEKVDAPFEFHTKNRTTLRDLQDGLVMIVRPDLLHALGQPAPVGFGLTGHQRRLVLRAMTEYPSQSENPRYDPERYPDDWVKFLLPGLARVVPAERILIANKVGRAYGFSIENTYVLDRETGNAFFLTANLYTNPNRVVNDGVYGYTRADEYFADLGEALARTLLAE